MLSIQEFTEEVLALMTIMGYDVRKGGTDVRNIPDFECQWGSAQLILQEIPHRQEAYCLINRVTDGGLAGLLWECAAFCRMAGAQRVLALDLPEEAGYPVAFRVLRMSAGTADLPKTDAAVWPLLPEQAETYLEHYNRAMARVPGARSLGRQDIPGLLEQGGCYFVHRDGQLLGLGQVEGGCVRALASLVPGAGRDVTAALLSVNPLKEAWLEVADTNGRAMKLYRRMGFVPVAVKEVWYDITDRRGDTYEL